MRQLTIVAPCFATSCCVWRIGLVTPAGTFAHPPSKASWSSVIEKTMFGQFLAQGGPAGVRSGYGMGGSGGRSPPDEQFPDFKEPPDELKREHHQGTPYARSRDQLVQAASCWHASQQSASESDGDTSMILCA